MFGWHLSWRGWERGRGPLREWERSYPIPIEEMSFGVQERIARTGRLSFPGAKPSRQEGLSFEAARVPVRQDRQVIPEGKYALGPASGLGRKGKGYFPPSRAFC